MPGGDSGHTIGSNTYPASVPSIAEYGGHQTNNTTLTLATALTATDLDIEVLELIDTLPGSGVVTIGTERIKYTTLTVATKTLHVLSTDDRGFDGSTATTHNAGDAVRLHVVAWHHNKLVTEQRALMAELGATGAQNFLRTDGTEPLTATWGVGNQDITNVQNLDVDGTTTAANIVPQADNTHDLGTAALRWRDVYVGPGSIKVVGAAGDAQPKVAVTGDGVSLGPGGATPADASVNRTGVGEVTIDADAVITGDLTVQGTTTTINSNVTTIDDNKIVLNDGEAGAGVSTLGTTAGIEIDRGILDNAELVFDEATDRFRTSYDAGATLHTVPELDRADTWTAQQTFGVGIKTDAVDEETTAAGVTIDGTLLKDGDVVADANLQFKSGTAFKAILDHANTADRTVTLPDFTGTVALLERAQTFTANQSLGDANTLSFGTTFPAVLSRGAADRLDLASGDSFNIVLGNLQFAGTTLFESDRDLAVDLIPNADNALNLGSAARNYANAYLKRTAGSVLFMGANGLVTENNATLFFNTGSTFLGIGTAAPSAFVHAKFANAGAVVGITAENTDNTNAASHAVFEASVGGGSTGDVLVKYTVQGATNFVHGIDNSDSDRWKLSFGAALGTGDIIMAASAAIGFLGAVPVARQADSGVFTSNGASANHALIDVATADIADPAKINANFDNVADGLNDIQVILRNFGLMS